MAINHPAVRVLFRVHRSIYSVVRNLRSKISVKPLRDMKSRVTPIRNVMDRT